MGDGEQGIIDGGGEMGSRGMGIGDWGKRKRERDNGVVKRRSRQDQQGLFFERRLCGGCGFNLAWLADYEVSQEIEVSTPTISPEFIHDMQGLSRREIATRQRENEDSSSRFPSIDCLSFSRLPTS